MLGPPPSDDQIPWSYATLRGVHDALRGWATVAQPAGSLVQSVPSLVQRITKRHRGARPLRAIRSLSECRRLASGASTRVDRVRHVRHTLGPVRSSLVALAVASALGAVGSCAPASSPAPAPASRAGGAFEGCTGVFTSVLGWSFSCDGTSVVTREGDDLEALLRGARESMRGAFAGPVEERRDDLQVGGVARKGMELSLRSAKKQLLALGTAAILEADGGPPRVVACLAGADDASQARCRQQLDELSTMAYAEMPPAAVHIRPRPVPAIAERPITAPVDCHLTANDRAGLLDCGDAVLGWNEPTDPKAIPSLRDATIEDTTRKMQLATPSALPPKRTSGACRVEGVAATCTVVTWPDATLTLGSAVVRGHTILAWCAAREGAGARVCDDTIHTGTSAAAPTRRPDTPPLPIIHQGGH